MRAAILPPLTLALLGAKPAVTFPWSSTSPPWARPPWSTRPGSTRSWPRPTPSSPTTASSSSARAVVGLPEANARLEDRADRNALGAFLQGGVVNAFIVASLRDVDDPTLLRQGCTGARTAGAPTGGAG
ncbi:MAG: hypothetical protein R3F43_31770 [bacterium]